jgi:agmatinase
MPRNPGTLFGVPHGPATATTDVAVLGLPFDVGAHPHRVGARTGPAHVRAHSAMVAEHARDFSLDLEIVDCGDVDVTPGLVEDAYVKIEQALTDILEAGATPLTIGGDGAVALPQMRALARNYDDLIVLHFDAHTDAYEPSGTFTNANPFFHAVNEQLVDPHGSFHIGLRDTPRIATARALGYQLVTVDEITSVRLPQGRPTYVCWDMDVFDPSVAPGVVTPSWGGLTTREGLNLIRSFNPDDIVAFDVNALSPPHDVNGQTGALAAHVMLEFLLLVARTR